MQPIYILKIAGIPYSVYEVEATELSESDSFGWFQPEKQRILIRKDLPHETKRATIWHEIVEGINHHYELKMSHAKITLLEAAVNQILADNSFFCGLYLPPDKDTKERISVENQPV